MKNVILTVLLMAASLVSQTTVVQSDCVTTTNNIPRLFDFTEFMHVGQPYTVEVFTDASTPFFVAIGTPTPLVDAGVLTGYAPWGVGSCFIVASELNTGSGVTCPDGRFLWTFQVPNDPLLVGTDILVQAYVACSGCPYGVAPTNGLAMTVQQ
tara:strand:+ start:15 stop:473 length:459 start_codon:yes stop_codon:yes gene_type:complete